MSQRGVSQGRTAPSETTGALRVASNYVRMAGTFIIGLLVVRVLLDLGEEAYGTVALLTATIGIGAVVQEVVRASVSPVLARLCNGASAAELSQGLRAVLWVCRAAAASLFLLFAGLFVLLPYLQIPDAFVGASTFFLTTKALQAVALVLVGPGVALLVAQEKMVSYNLLLLTERTADLGAAAVSAAVAAVGASPESSIMLYAGLSSLLIVLCHLGWLAFAMRGAPYGIVCGASTSFSDLKEHARACLVNSSVIIANNLHLRVDALLVNGGCGVIGNLVFGVASQVACYLRMMIMGMVIGLEAVTARLSGVRGGGDVRAVLRSSTSQVAHVLFPASMALFFLAEPLTDLWLGSRLEQRGTDVQVIARVVCLLIPGVVARSFAEQWMTMLAGVGQAGRFSKAAVLGVLLNVAVSCALLAGLPGGARLYAAPIGFSVSSLVVYGGVLPGIVCRALGESRGALFGVLAKPAAAAVVSSPALVFGVGAAEGNASRQVVLAVGGYTLALCTVFLARRTYDALRTEESRVASGVAPLALQADGAANGLADEQKGRSDSVTMTDAA